MIEPLLRCTVCRHRCRECHAHRAGWGRWRGHLVAPCRHPLIWHEYIDPRTGAYLQPWGRV